MLVSEARVDLVKWTLNISHHGSYLPRRKHPPPLTHHAFRTPSLVGTLYVCEPLFSGMNLDAVERAYYGNSFGEAETGRPLGRSGRPA